MRKGQRPTKESLNTRLEKTLVLSLANIVNYLSLDMDDLRPILANRNRTKKQ